jgi:hypothetical protein
VVERRSGAYLRTYPYIPQSEEFETLSITGRDLIMCVQGRYAVSNPALSRYLELYAASLAEDVVFISPTETVVSVPGTIVRQRLQKHESILFTAAKDFDIDPYLIGAILIDEIARIGPFEIIIDAIGGNIVGLNVSVGIAQVKLDTANDLIKKDVYNPNPQDKKLPFTRLSNVGRAYLYDYLIQSGHNIRFAAAFLRYVTDLWASHINLTERPEILATLYSLGYGNPKRDPKPTKRGTQIIEEFYPLAQKWLA